VEATKFTEVGYVGRDVDSMIRDLVDMSVKMVRDEEQERLKTRAAKAAEERLLDLLLPPPPGRSAPRPAFEEAAPPAEPEVTPSTRERFRKMLRAGELDDRIVPVEVSDKSAMPMVEVFSGSGMEDINFKDMLGNIFPKRKKSRQVKVPEALELLTTEEAEKMLDMDAVVKDAVSRAEQSGIVFIDELDKIAGRDRAGSGPDVSRQGVQRDILPLVEGSAVNTKYGIVRTDHILFIAAGAFHMAKPSDLIPELQGRFPIRVELDALGRDDFERILREPRNSLVRQYTAMLATEGVTLEFGEDAISAIAEVAAVANQRMENIGARRLHTILELVLDEIGFDAPEKSGATVRLDAAMVRERLVDVLEDEDLSRYIL
jgi:ATP-dependent HslUV protease ATP-binding subunit HslU